MTFHLLKYRLKCFLRDRQMLFWTLAFPLLLATLFHLAFSNLMNIDQFIDIKLAVVDSPSYRANHPLQEALSAVSDPANDESLFTLQVVTQAEAENLLQAKTIDGYILSDPDLRLVVKESGLNQSIARQFLDDYNQIFAAYGLLAERHPERVPEELLQLVMQRNTYTQSLPVSSNPLDPAVVYFFSLIAMNVLYGGFWGLRVVSEVQADLTPQGARVSLAPVHKLKLLLTDISAVFVIHFVLTLVVIAYITQVLGHSFGQKTALVVLTAAVGSFVGISLGACIAALVKKGEGVKAGVLISATMTMTFLSGMMYHGIKYWVSQTLPVLAWINPANLVTDAFYALYYYDTLGRYSQNITILVVMGIVFNLLTYRVLRRQSYDSL